MSATLDLSGLRLLSFAPNRERWEIKGLRRQPRLASDLECALAQYSGVIQAVANPLTGRVLLLMERANASRDTAQIILRCLRQVTSGQGVAPIDESTAAQTLSDGPTSGATSRGNALYSLVRGSEPANHLRRKAVALSLTNTVFKISTPLLQGLIMSSVIIGGIPVLSSLGLSMVQQIVVLSGAWFTSASLEKTFQNRRKIAWLDYSGSVEESLRRRVYQHVLNLDLKTLSEQDLSSVRLTNLVKDDVSRIQKFLEMSAPNLLDKSLTFLACSIFLLWISPAALLLALIPIPVIFLLTRRYNRESNKLYQNVDRLALELDSMLANTLQDINTVKSFTAEHRELLRLVETNRGYSLEYGKAGGLSSEFHTRVEFGIYCGIVLPIIYGSYQIYTHHLGFASFTSMCFLLPLLVFATQGLDRDLGYYQEALRSAGQLAALLALGTQTLEGKIRLDPAHVKGEVHLQRVSFGYAREGSAIEANGHVLRDLTVRIKAGSTVAFVGATGSGKSTLGKLLLRFYDPDSGSIELDGVNLREIEPSDIRRAVAWVSQDVYLFKGTIYENIHYGNANSSHQQVLEAARLAQAEEFIQAQPDGFATMVGERGQNLSGGERQRISIARALLKNAPILILDEATSAMDNRTEAALHDSILKLRAGRTLIVIAHRLSIASKADCIHLLEKGELRESGSHEELLAAGSVYAGLWALQVSKGASGGTTETSRI